MPPVIAAAAVAAATATATGIIAGTLTLASVAIAVGGSLLMSGASMLMAGGRKRQSQSSLRGSTTITSRQAVGYHQIIYGQRRIGGQIVFQASTQDNLYLHLVIVLAAHEVEAIDEVWFGDDVIPNDALDASGNVTSGKYSGVARIRKALGTATQAADSVLMAEVAEWTANHRLRGRAYIYVRLQYDGDVFSSGLPNISAVVRGAKVYDPRSGNTAFSSNVALFARDYLASPSYGFEASANIDDTAATSAANICDEIVAVTNSAFSVSSVDAASDIMTVEGDRLLLALGDRVQIASSGSVPSGLSAATDYYVIPYQFGQVARVKLATSLANAMAYTAINITSAGSGTITLTKTGEPRYHGAGILDTSQNLGDNFTQILTGFNGKAVYAGGSWRIMAGGYVAPTITLDENDFTSEIQIQTKIPRRDRFNKVSGVYNSHINDWQGADYPALIDDAAAVRDGQTIARDFDLPFTNRPYTAQRIAKIELKKAAQEITVLSSFTLKAMQLQAGDTVMITNARMGWTAKVFEVTSFKLNFDESMTVELQLRETSSDVYTWETTEESVVDTAPNTSLPNATSVSVVTGVAFDSTPINTQGGDTFYNMLLTWNAHSDAFVSKDGRFEIQFKLETESEYRPSFFVNGELTKSNLTQATIGETYDIRIRAVNNIGVRSNWSNLTGAVAGSSGGVGSTIDWGEFTHTTLYYLDYGDWTSSPTSFNDWETFT